MKILIYGGGAVGLGIASCLIKSGEHIEVFDREGTVTALMDKGLVRTGIFGEFRADPSQFNAYHNFEDLEKNEYDIVLVCIKSRDTSSAAESLNKCINTENGKTKIVLFQNGWGNAEIFTRFFPEPMIYNARVITGFSKPAPNETDITAHAQPIHIGSLYGNAPGDLPDLCRAVSNGDIPCEWTDDIEKDLWAKMLYNCILNPLGAIFNVPYGELGRSAHARSVMQKVSGEIFEVIRKAGYKTHWETSEEYLNTLYEKLLPPTAGHEASMLQDIRKKRKTEIDALNGAVVRLGEAFRVDVTVNRMVSDMVKFIETLNCSDPQKT